MAHSSRIQLLAIAAATALTLAACGGGGDDSSSSGGAGNPGSGGGGAGTVKQLTAAEKTAIKDAHNDARASGNLNPAPATPLTPLDWDDSLADIAAAYSAKCNFAHSNNGYGENLWMGTSGHFTVADAVASWVGEGKQFVYGQNSSTWGHYTQIVYHKAAKVGCGWATCPDGYDIMTCNYDQIQPNYSTPYPIN